MTKLATSFPKKFLWGASSSAHQVEGGTHNQWTAWELENAASLAVAARYHFGDVVGFKQFEKQAKNPANYVSGKAVDHYNRYETDFDLLKKMNMNAWRFSIEWSRVEPEKDAWNSAAIDHYRSYLLALKKREITPIVTLFHFTLPEWFSAKGGFEKRANIKYFERFVAKIVDELGAHFRYVITINEPQVYAFESYSKGNWPPAHVSKREALKVLGNCIRAHNRVAKAIKQSSRKFQISMAYNIAHVYAGDDARLSEMSAHIVDFANNHYILKRTIKSCDFIGLNYYFSDRIYGYRTHNPNEYQSDLGWDMQPSDIRRVIEELHDRYNKPVFVTENGLADANDSRRQWWLKQTLEALSQAIKGGVPVIGYLHWSLTDNFEWDKGRWPRFGLFAVNYATMERTPRPSAVALAKILRKIRGL